MDNIDFIVKKNQLIALIREVARLWCEDEQFIKTYCDDQVEAYKDELDKAIACFRDLKAQAEKIVPLRPLNSVLLQSTDDAGGGNAANRENVAPKTAL